MPFYREGEIKWLLKPQLWNLILRDYGADPHSPSKLEPFTLSDKNPESHLYKSKGNLCVCTRGKSWA